MKLTCLLTLLVILAGCDDLNPVVQARKQQAIAENQRAMEVAQSERALTARDPSAAPEKTPPTRSDRLLSLFKGRDFSGKSIVDAWRGECVGITDGNTVQVMRDRAPVKIRVESIDSPELGQPFGEDARKFASNFCFGKDVMVLETGADRDSSSLAFIIADAGAAQMEQNNLSAALLSAGLAWHDKENSDDAELAKLETEAREAERGLWAATGPGEQVPPWDWRKR